MRRVWLALPVVAVLAGCSGSALVPGEPAPAPVRSWGTAEPGSWAADAVDVVAPSRGSIRVAAGVNNQHELLVTTWGSSTCPRLPASVEADGSSVVVTTKEFTLFGGRGCDSDLRPMTSAVALPPGVGSRTSLRVVIDGTPVTARPV